MRRAVATAILAAFLSGCDFWKDEEKKPPQPPVLPSVEEKPSGAEAEEQETAEEDGEAKFISPTTELLSDSDKYRVILKGEPVVDNKIYGHLAPGGNRPYLDRRSPHNGTFL